MLDGEDTLKYCLKNHITIEQFFILYLLARGDMNKPRSLGRDYIEKIGIFSYEALQGLVKRGFITDFNSPGEFKPELYMLTPETLKQFTDMDMAEELWEAYPITFRIGQTSMFVARAGGDKDELLALYLQKINFSSQKHKVVLTELKRYEKMVSLGLINGYKISDFIRQELWDTIAQIPVEQEGGDFGKDI